MRPLIRKSLSVKAVVPPIDILSYPLRVLHLHNAMPPLRLFEFLRYTVTPQAHRQLSFRPTAEDWSVFFSFCCKHALLGIGFSTVESLYSQGVECPKALRLKWMSLALQIEQRNKKMDAMCGKITDKFAKNGFNCCILKGQGNQFNYPAELAHRRQSGDIDIWLTPKEKSRAPIKQIVGYVQLFPGHHKACYHHIDMMGPDNIELEVHYRPSYLRSFLSNRKLQRWFQLHTNECMANNTALNFSIPTASVNVVYQMLHLYSHVFEEGIGLRQFVDYYFVLSAWYDKLSKRSEYLTASSSAQIMMEPMEIRATFAQFGMQKFVAGVMWILQYVFSMPDEWLLYAPDEKRGRLLLDEIMLGGNFGQHDIRGWKMKHGGALPHSIWKLRRMIRLVRTYPKEALSEPFFRIYHWIWRTFELWKY